MRVPDEVIKSVVFLGYTVKGKHGAEDFDWLCGTGFFVAVRLERIEASLTYLVTADHVANDLEGKDSWARCNMKDGGFARIRFGPVKWKRLADKTADLAVLPCGIDPKLDQHAIPSSILISGRDMMEKLQVTVGDETFTAGLFVLATGQQRNTPLVRLGLWL
jgi:hypothetical protein